MPNPILAGLRNIESKRDSFMGKPLIPQESIQGMQDSLTEPHLDQSPFMASVKGFGAGALTGLRNLSTPTNITALAGIALGAHGGPGKPPQGEPSMNPLGVREPYPLAKYGEPWLRTSDPEFVPPGGEGQWNEIYQHMQAPKPEDLAYSRIMQNKGASAK